MESRKLTPEEAEAVIKKIGEEAALKILSGEVSIVLEENPKQEFKVWKTIKLGGFKKSEEIFAALYAAGMKFSNWAADLIRAIKIQEEEREINLVKIRVEQLGFHRGASTQDIYSQIKKRGLDLCPAEVGPQLRLQYSDQPKEEWFFIGMIPLLSSYDKHLRIFYIGHNERGLWLHSHWGDPFHFWDPEEEWIFCQL